jgi:uncharacterized RDD family membrane protein YckC
MKTVNKGDRIINFVIDYLVITVIFLVVEVIFGYFYYSPSLVFYTIMVLYYFISEAINAQTIGKKVTGTIVVNMHNEKPSIQRIFLRSLLRLNPFDYHSYAFGNEQGGHDLISKTRLVYKTNFQSKDS